MSHALRRIATTLVAMAALFFLAQPATASPGIEAAAQPVQLAVAGPRTQLPADLIDKLKDVGCLVSPIAPGSPDCGAKRAVKVAKAVEPVKNVIDFWKDPFGAIAGKMQEAASGLTNQVLPELIKATTPKFTVGWFVEAYRVSFGIGLALFGLLLLRTFVDFSRGKAGSEDVIDTVAVEGPRFVLGSAFGPVVAGAVVGLFEWLAVGIVKWGLGGSITDIGDGARKIDALIKVAAPNSLPGGAITAILVYAMLIFGLFLMVLIMLVAYVTLYMSGAVAPIAWAWLGHPDTRDRAWKIIRVFSGLVVAKPIAFMMLSIALMITADGLFGMSPTAKAVQTLVGIAAAAIALIMAAFSPMILNKFAVGVGPTEATGASPSPRFSKGSGRGTRGGPGASTASNGQLAQASSQGGGGAAKTAAAGVATGGTGMMAAMAAAAAGKFKDKLQGTAQDAAQEGTGAGSEGSTVDASTAYSGGKESGGLASQNANKSDGEDGTPEQDDKTSEGEESASTGVGSGTHIGSGSTSGQDETGSGQGGDGGRSLGDASGSSTSESGSGEDGSAGSGGGQGGGFGQKLAGATAATGRGAGVAAKVGAGGLRQAAAKGSSMADTLDEHLDSHIDHAATTGRRPR